MVIRGFVTFGDSSGATILQADIQGNLTSEADIAILDDNILEDEEGFIVVLFPSDSVSNSILVFSVTIVDFEGLFSSLHYPAIL